MTAIDCGPQTPQVEELIARIGTLIDDETTRLAAALDAAPEAAQDIAQDIARDVAWYAVRYAARGTAWYAVRRAALEATRDTPRYDTWYAARDAVLALMVRDLITTEHYDVLTRPWRQAIGRIHPDDPDLREDTP